MKSSATSASISEQLQNAVQLHQAGHLLEAERIYDAVLKRQPRHADALNLKGLIALDQGRLPEAVKLLRRAAELAPSFAPVHFNLGNALAAGEQPHEALAPYRKAIAIDPAFADAYLNAGFLLEKLNRIDEAVAAFQTMIRVCPADPRAYRNLALCLVKSLPTAPQDTLDAIAANALAAFERACALNPADRDSHFEFGNLLMERGNYGDAIVQFETAVKLNPDWVEAISNLGEALRKAKCYDDAVATQRRALALRPDDQIILSHLGSALLKTRDYAEAEDIFRRLMEKDPCALLPYINLGEVYRESGRAKDAVAILEQALLRVPGSHQAYSNLSAVLSEQGWWSAAYLMNEKALSLKDTSAKSLLNQGVLALSLGRFREGWSGYEYRFEIPEEFMPRRATPPPQWHGEDVAGKRILIWTEQGIGDEILYASMISDIVSRGAQCVVACSQRLVPIFERSFPNCAVVGYKKSVHELSSMGEFDFQSSVISLGIYLRSDLPSFPRRPGFLRADATNVAALRTKYEVAAKGRRIVGLAWRSSAANGMHKGATLLDFAPLLAVKDVLFVNLQYGDCSAELAAVHDRLGLEVYQDSTIDPLIDMDAFFAQVAAMDLVVTTSNTTAHVAGAQNVPVWVLLPVGKGLLWYWFLRGTESVWYPSAMLVRSARLERCRPWWRDPIDIVARELAHWASPNL